MHRAIDYAGGKGVLEIDLIW